MTKTRIAIIGCGVVAPAHLDAYRKIDDVELAWACDLVDEKARNLASIFGVEQVTKDYRQVLKDPSVEGISICTDHASHAPIAVAALRAGKHVLCEKALSSSTRKLNAMMEAHEQCPSLVFSGVFQHRFDPILRYLKKLVSEGTLGTILTAGTQVRCVRGPGYYEADPWRGTWDKEGGSVLINQAIHFIDAISWIMGGVHSVSGSYGNLTHGDTIETEDTATASVQYKSGALGTIEATCSSHLNWETTLAIHGTLGSVEIRDDKPLKIHFGDKAQEQRVGAEFMALAGAPALQVGKSYYGAGHPAQIADFVDAIRSKREPFVSARSARHTVDIVMAIYKSHRMGRRIVVDSSVND